MTEGKTIIEVNGVKLEVDLRSARRIDEIRVGDRVKVLLKTYDSYKVCAGTVVGFEPFEKLPTIVVAYVEVDYNKSDVKFLHFNSQTKDTEIIKAIDADHLDIDRATVLDQLDRQVAVHRRGIEDLEARRKYFLDHFSAYWAPVAAPVPAEPFR